MLTKSLRSPNWQSWCSFDDQRHAQYLEKLYANPNGDARTKISVFCYQDFANVMSNIAYHINEHSPDYQMRVISVMPHPFRYWPPHSLDYDACTKHDIFKEYIAQSKIAIWAEESMPGKYYSYYFPGQECLNALTCNTGIFKNPDVVKIIWHAGCPYREAKSFYSENDPKNFDAGFFSPDLFPSSLETDWYIYSIFGQPFPTDFPKKKIPDSVADLPKDKLVLLHSPTNYYLKGTANIRAAVKPLTNEFPWVSYMESGGPYHEGKAIPFEDAIQDRLKADIYIDQVSYVGGIGQSSLEAMTSGVIPLCTVQNIAKEAWPEDCPVITVPYYVNDDLQISALYGILRGLVLLYRDKPEQYLKLITDGQKWIQANLEPPAFVRDYTDKIREIESEKDSSADHEQELP